MREIALAMVAALAACGPRYEDDPSKAGPYPTAYRSIVNSYVRTSFLDPYSVRDASISTPVIGHMYSQQGWIACLRANAKNRMGGYAGQQSTALLIYQRSVVDSDAGAAVCDVQQYAPFPEVESIGARGK